MIFNVRGPLTAALPPEYTYTGKHELIDDGGGNWRIKFKSSGTLVFTKLLGARLIDVFLVGGGGGGDIGNNPAYIGGGGGGGGETTTAHKISCQANKPYEIVVGAGRTGNGKASAAFGQTADGGSGGASDTGGYGGSYGGAGSFGAGGAGEDGASDGDPGQGFTTREFEEPDGDLYSGGGGGGSIGSGAPGAGGAGGGGAGDYFTGADGEPNTGGGGGGGGDTQERSKGGSGIVIIRNARR